MHGPVSEGISEWILWFLTNKRSTGDDIFVVAQLPVIMHMLLLSIFLSYFFVHLSRNLPIWCYFVASVFVIHLMPLGILLDWLISHSWISGKFSSIIEQLEQTVQTKILKGGQYSIIEKISVETKIFCIIEQQKYFERRKCWNKKIERRTKNFSQLNQWEISSIIEQLEHFVHLDRNKYWYTQKIFLLYSARTWIGEHPKYWNKTSNKRLR